MTTELTETPQTFPRVTIVIATRYGTFTGTVCPEQMTMVNVADEPYVALFVETVYGKFIGNCTMEHDPPPVVIPEAGGKPS